ncbi:rho-related BTB domain-containing protein 2-like [Uloborus diversus]|uniref:rho-related BTB domain-containing protein 2-like n=1 Tax=Uloborus diversus TaxID=327109 RepID=UPI0024096707|nr:rho-related BTB domain-containing protein 2-like [Uloborus diversus]
MSWHNGTETTPRQENVKCVVVGDTAVGKTRLICAQACNAFLTLPQMLATHIPTVWAIDQYRIQKEVLRRSWMVVDGVHVSLRLWDTFGDHEKDRKFAYGRADVVLLCYSVSSHQSLKNCKTKWYPEIREYCPDTPIVLVGCKNDLRHIYRDEGFLELCRERNPFARTIQERDMVTREQGRLLAKEIGATYYETSVFTRYGVPEVFENTMRLALIGRRQQRFWVKSLKNVQEPMLQMPYCPPEPEEPKISALESTYEIDVVSLLDKEYEPDVKIIVGSRVFHSHKFILAAASSYFHQIFISLSEVKVQQGNKYETLTAFKEFSPSTISSFLRFVYSGEVGTTSYIDLSELQEVAEITSIFELKVLMQEIQSGNDISEIEIKKKYLDKLIVNLKKICLQSHLFSDVIFEVDDGKCHAHRSVLMARCVVMAAMFGGDFRESFTDVIPFPGVSTETFSQCLHYLYTDSIHDSITVHNCIAIIELANRLCLPHFISLIETRVVEQLNLLKLEEKDLSDLVLYLLEHCQVHNAHQLSDWCQYYIIINYVAMSIKYPKLLRSLHPDNQAYLNKNRWPPLHYLKEQDYYERCLREREQKEKPPKFLLWKTAKKKVNECLNSTNRNKQSAEDSKQAEMAIKSNEN